MFAEMRTGKETVDHGGAVHDPTWPAGTALAYLGIPFSRACACFVDATSPGARALRDAHREDHRLLRAGTHQRCDLVPNT